MTVLSEAPFSWTQATGTSFLPNTLFPAPSIGFAFVNAISGDGSATVGVSATVTASEAFIWTHSSGMTLLGDLAGGQTSSEAKGISSDGLAVVGVGESASGQEAFLWTQAGGMIGLGDLSGGVFNSIATSTSADGFVVVGLSESTAGIEVFRWTQTDGMVGLGLTTSEFFFKPRISADGTTVVGNVSPALGTGEAFRWTAGNGVVLLGDGGGLFSNSYATGVSGDGEIVVGTANTPSFQNVPFVWTPVAGMMPLNDLLVSGFGLDTSAWRIFGASAISDDGTVILGSGHRLLGSFTGFFVATIGPLPRCAGDADGNGVVDFADVTSVLGNWQNSYGTATGPADADGSGVIDFSDITTILGNWNVTCPSHHSLR